MLSTTTVKTLGLAGSGTPMPRGQPHSKPSARAGCHQTCQGRCQGMREVKDQPLPSPSHPSAGSQEHPQLLGSAEEQGLCEKLGMGSAELWHQMCLTTLTAAALSRAASSTYGMGGVFSPSFRVCDGPGRREENSREKESSKQPPLSPAGWPDGKALPKTMFVFSVYLKTTHKKLHHYIGNMQVILIVWCF